MNTANILIRDPYLNSASKTDNGGTSTYYGNRPNQTYVPNRQGSYAPHGQQSKQNNELKRQLDNTKYEFKRMTRAFSDQNRLNQKILGYQTVNNEYHQALKVRNLDLNNKLMGLATNNKLLNQQLEVDYVKNFQDKDNLIKKYQTQSEEILHLKKTINDLLTLKGRMEEQILQLRFVIENQNDRFNLDNRQQGIRLQGMERTMRNLSEAKDQQISQLRNRLRIYQDENKKLNDENRSLHLTNKQHQNKKGIQNLSQIHHLDSQTKSYQKQNIDGNIPFHKQLNQQKIVNDKLQKQINQLKRKLFDNNNQQNLNNKKDKLRPETQEKHLHRNLQKQDFIELSQSNGYVGSINTIRNGISKQVFDVFFKSVRDGQKHRSNSLVIFIQNWKHLDIDRLEPYVQSYFESRNSLKGMYKNKKESGQLKTGPLSLKIQECIPLYVGSRKGRSQINQWILSTIQFTKNQRESSKKSLNNLLLFLFRLLTIQYRITYPMQGKSYTIDTDVKNQLHHETVKAVDYIRKFK